MPSYPPIAAFFAGVLSFLSPCVLPLVPGYVSLISGASVEELQQQKQARRAVMLHSIAFIVGFSIVFVIAGATATTIGQLASIYRVWLTRIAGVVIIVFGLHLIGVLKIKALYMDKRLHDVKGGASMWGAFAVGFAFAFGWTPCIGPILAGILALASEQDTVVKGMALLAIYSLGLAVPFLLTSFGIERFLKFYTRFRRHLHTVEVVSGVLLVVIGLLILTRHFTVLSGYLGFLNRFSL
jgi:cytochrome c-type biogenesis protein